MSKVQTGEITRLLASIRNGDSDALDRLLSLMYPSLRGMASKMLRQERNGHILQPTALVNEAIIRLFLGREEEVHAHDRTHLMALAGRQMRQVLVEHARGRLAARRGGGLESASLGDEPDPASRDLESLLVLDDLLNQLREVDARAGEVVELRFFAGLSREEVAARLGVTVRTVQRDWEFARAWFLDMLVPG